MMLNTALRTGGSGAVAGMGAGGAALVATAEAEASPLALHEPFGDGVPIGINGTYGGASSYREAGAARGAVMGASGGLDGEGKTGVANWVVQSRALGVLPCSNEMRSELCRDAGGGVATSASLLKENKGADPVAARGMRATVEAKEGGALIAGTDEAPSSAVTGGATGGGMAAPAPALAAPMPFSIPI